MYYNERLSTRLALRVQYPSIAVIHIIVCSVIRATSRGLPIHCSLLNISVAFFTRCFAVYCCCLFFVSCMATLAPVSRLADWLFAVCLFNSPSVCLSVKLVIRRK